jgi:hypothetical protein
MSLHYAFTFDTVGTGQIDDTASGGGLFLLRSGWYYYEGHGGCDADLISASRQPIIGYGGSYRALRLEGYNGGIVNQCFLYSPSPSFSLLTDGIFQFHTKTSTYGYDTAGRQFLYLRSGPTDVLRLNYVSDGRIQIYYWNASSWVYCLTTTDLALRNDWHTIAIRLKTHETEGIIGISIDGGTPKIETDLAMNHALGWERYCFMSDDLSYTYRYFAQISVFTDTSDEMLATQKWVTQLRPTADATAPDDDWDGSSTITPNLYQDVNNLDSDSEYCTTLVQDAEIRFNPNYTETPANGGIEPSGETWEPPVIDGVVVNAIMRGDGTLNQGQTVVSGESGVDADYGDLTTLSGDAKLITHELFITHPETGLAWEKADLTGTETEFGVKAS